VGLLTVGSLYMLAKVAYFRVLPFAYVAGSSHIASDVVQFSPAPEGPLGSQWAMAISALGALRVVVLTGARIPYAMSRDGVFFRFAEHLHPSFRTPSGSLVLLGSVAALQLILASSPAPSCVMQYRGVA
jgi:basic amino acid/polyamine antiporter, APA family